MRRFLSLSICLVSSLGVSCGRTIQESVIEVNNDAFKADVRSQEFGHSGIVNVDICVAESNSTSFPTDRRQCFLHGFDFSDLSVYWLSERDLSISFDCGRVTTFSNFTTLSDRRDVPVEFHARLHDRCGEIKSVPKVQSKQGSIKVVIIPRLKKFSGRRVERSAEARR